MSTIRELIESTEIKLDECQKDANVAKVLLYHLANLEPHQLYLKMDEPLDAIIINKFNESIELYISGKPVQYIKGVENFFGRDFIVNENVLIPRYETEELVEQVLYKLDDYFDNYDSIQACDVGTGSGAISISVALEESRINMIATDISVEALEVAKLNAKKLNANITFKHGDMLEPLKGSKFDLFLSNPPYIPVEQEIESVVKDNEPHVALFGGEDGLYFYRKIFSEVKELLNDKALLGFEMGFDQRELMENAVKEYFDDEFEIIKDINGKDRMLFIYYGFSK